MNKKIFHRLLLPLAMIGLIAGIWAGLIRSGWSFSFSHIAAHHGALMVGSFLGTLIIIERAVTFKEKWILLIPLINAFSIPLFFLDIINPAIDMLIIGGVGMFVLFVIISYRHPAIYHYIITAGALCYVIGSIILINTHSYPATFQWWMAFFMLTIVGERLELSRFLNINKLLKSVLVLLLGIFMIGVILPFHSQWGDYFFAAGLAGSGLWLMRYDMALKAVKKEGQFRYSGILLITGYIWLLITAAIVLFAPGFLYSYDAGLHAFFLGFVFSMIFAHAPIILPAVVGVLTKPYHPILYFWFVLFQLSLIVRIAADLLELPYFRYWSALITSIAIIFFFINMMILTFKKD